jgi:B-cell receptor-associated protein 31
MAIFLVLLLPIPSTWRLVIVKLLAAAISKIKLSLIFVFLLFGDAVYDSIRKRHTDGMFYAQRNMYLTGSVIFLSLVLNRFLSMMADISKNEQRNDVLKQQAAKSSKEYLKLLDNEQDYLSKIARLESELVTLRKQQTELDIVKKQAAQISDEYLRLTDRYAELEAKGSAESKKTK